MHQVTKLRERFNLSRKDISDILDSSIKYVVEIEKGQKILTKSDIEKLCKRFDLQPNFFYKTSDQPTNISEWDAVLGRNVKHFREINGMTQQMLAEELGFAGPATVSGIERGLKPIGKKALLKLADLFDIHVSELFNYHDPSIQDSHNRLISRFTYILNHKQRPRNWEALLEGVDKAYRDLVEE